MKIVLTHPYCWPYVRRGSERFLAELARDFTSRGHEVVTISSRPGAFASESTEHGPRILLPQRWNPLMAKVRIQPTHMFAPGCLRRLLRIDADVIFCLHYIDSWAANIAKRLRGFKTVYYVTGPPVPGNLSRIPPDRGMMRAAICKSDRVITLGNHVASLVRTHYGVDPDIIPVPVDVKTFTEKTAVPEGRPILLGIASFDELRKGIRVLVNTFVKIKATVPDAILRLSGRFPESLQEEVLGPVPPAIRRDIEVLGVGSIGDLPSLYREASVTVIPSMREAYGMTALESLACGTPVVGTDHAGLGELLCNPVVSVKFDPQTDGLETSNIEGLTEAILAGLELSRRPETIGHCRTEAEKYSWKVLGPRYESLLLEMVAHQ